MPLTDEEILAAFASSDGTFVSSGRAIEAAILAKLREQKPVAYWNGKHNDARFSSKYDAVGIGKSGITLFTHPVPIPEGWQPIHTYPKDGSNFIVYCRKHGVKEMNALSMKFLLRRLKTENVWIPTHWKQLNPPDYSNISDEDSEGYKAMLAAARSE